LILFDVFNLFVTDLFLIKFSLPTDFKLKYLFDF
jgi:hypothetical protein